MWLLEATLRNVDHLEIEEAKTVAIWAREKGMYSEIMSNDEAKRRGYLDLMQDLTKLKTWEDVA